LNIIENTYRYFELRRIETGERGARAGGTLINLALSVTVKENRVDVNGIYVVKTSRRVLWQLSPALDTYIGTHIELKDEF